MARADIDEERLQGGVARAALELEDERDLDPLLERIGDARFVLLGEASHGTSEYYAWRARLSRRLIREKGFSFVAVEGDWPDCYRVNRWVKGYGADGDAREALGGFERWPAWMWSNWETAAFTTWLREHNDGRPEAERVGFYGLDVYSLWESLGAVTRYLQENRPDALEAALRAFRCFEPYAEDPQSYAHATALVPTACEDEVVDVLAALRRETVRDPDDPEARFDAEQNARALVGAERYYRTMMRGGGASWNVRDHHMMDTLDGLMEHHGPDAKAIVWEHNTHVGDARATDMAAAGMVNVGQLARERHERDGVVLVGFGSHRGSVIAGDSWGAPLRRMEVPPAVAGSWEAILHDAIGGDALLLLDGVRGDRDFEARRGHRAIGVVYDPARERFGNYVPTVLPRRYDAFVYLDETRALHPLRDGRGASERPQLYPWGL